GCIDETGAGRRHVEGEGIARADFGLYEAGGGGKLLIRIDIGADDAVDVFGNHSGPLHRRYGRESAEVRGLQGRILGKDMPLADASAGGDPLVRGIHHFLKVGIGQDVFGMVNPYAADDRAHQATWLNLAAIFSATLLLAS